MRNIFSSLFLLFLLTSMTFSQVDPEHFRVFTNIGDRIDLKNVIKEIKKSDVIFLGENHDDSVAHSLQFEIFKNIFEKYGKKRNVTLSLEMFERDVQIILDEYLNELITEKHFLDSSRPWGNYQTDYRPLIELAKENNLKVIAANAPRRYVNMVSRDGRDSLDKLTPVAKHWLAPMPYPNSSKTYSDKFNALMGGHGTENILQSQTLWDATMAHSIAEHLKHNKKSLVVHLNGSFHTANRLGTVEQLLNYKPKTKILVITMLYEEDFKTFDNSKHKDLGDFVILTDTKQPRSKR